MVQRQHTAKKHRQETRQRSCYRRLRDGWNAVWPSQSVSCRERHVDCKAFRAGVTISNFIGGFHFSYFEANLRAILNWIRSAIVTVELGKRLYTYSFQWFFFF